MLIVKLDKHDLIFGRKWAAEARVLIDCYNRKLIWPDDYPQQRWSRVIAANKRDLLPTKTNLKH